MQPGAVRIIGGKWRGRKISVPDEANLRPTPDRVRETVFNWLTPVILNTRCLDLFAGSGVLGFESLSRGASHVEMVDASAKVVQHLIHQAQILTAENISIYQASIPKQLKKPSEAFNIVFLDPPYAANLLLTTAHYLEEQHFLASTAYIYLEASDLIQDQDLPKHWRIIKSKKAGLVHYHLAQRQA